MWGPGGSWWTFGVSLLGLVFLGLIVAGIVLVIRGSIPDKRGPASARGALDILDERFALGEIDQEEYESRKRLLLGRG